MGLGPKPSPSASEDSLEHVFGTYGKLEDVHVMSGRSDIRSTNYTILYSTLVYYTILSSLQQGVALISPMFDGTQG